jgi:hypothetical protein
LLVTFGFLWLTIPNLVETSISLSWSGLLSINYDDYGLY